MELKHFIKNQFSSNKSKIMNLIHSDNPNTSIENSECTCKHRSYYNDHSIKRHKKSTCSVCSFPNERYQIKVRNEEKYSIKSRIGIAFKTNKKSNDLRSSNTPKIGIHEDKSENPNNNLKINHFQSNVDDVKINPIDGNDQDDEIEDKTNENKSREDMISILNNDKKYPFLTNNLDLDELVSYLTHYDTIFKQFKN